MCLQEDSKSLTVVVLWTVLRNSTGSKLLLETINLAFAQAVSSNNFEYILLTHNLRGIFIIEAMDTMADQKDYTTNNKTP